MLNKVLNLIFPRRCVGCGSYADLPVCVVCCRGLFEQLVNREKSSLVLGGTVALPVISAVRYDPDAIIARVIRQYKYSYDRSLVDMLVDLLYYAVWREAPWLFWRLSELIVVPIPPVWLHKQRRGFDHTLLLAKGLAARLGCSCWAGLQNLTVFSDAGQAHKSGQQRRTNRKLGFTMRDPPVDLSKHAGGSLILLIDDVITTGSTMRAAAEVVIAATSDDNNFRLLGLTIATRL